MQINLVQIWLKFKNLVQIWKCGWNLFCIAFYRLALIFRANWIDFNTTTEIFDKRSKNVKSHHFWPTLDDKEWIKLENELIEIIKERYKRKLKDLPKYQKLLTIRDLIFGLNC